MKENKKQHYVPEFYLKAWCDPNTPQGYEPYVWVVSKDGSYIKPKAPSNVFHETDLYTIKVGEKRDTAIEKSLAQIESEFSEVRRNKLEKHLILDDYDKAVICAFAAAMYSRTLASGERWRPFWSDFADDFEEKIKQLEEWGKNATPEQLENIYPPTINDQNNIVTYDQIREVADEPLKSLISVQFEVLIPIFLKLDLAILETATKPGFITSDDPCVWLDPQLPNYPRLAGPALISPTIEIHLPISPTQCILFNRRGDRGYINLAKFGPIAENTVVTEVNWRTRTKSNRYFIVNKKVVLAKWFTYY